jgi:hypothetical protein
MRCLLSLATLICLTATAQANPKPRALLDDWNALVNGGCDLEKHNVRTPIEASVLRNTPYAMAGYAFKSAGLRAIFSADGRWYTPTSKATPKFHKLVGPCIKKLKALEAKMKAQVGNTKALKEQVFKDRAAYLDVRNHSRYMKRGTSVLKATFTGFSVQCHGCAGLNYYELVCIKDEGCQVLVPGTGDVP